MLYNGYPCHPGRPAVVALPLLQQPPRNSRREWPRQPFGDIGHDGVCARTIERRSFLLESAQSYPFGETGTGPTPDTNIFQAQAEEWMDGIEQRREDYETQEDSVIRRIGGESVDNQDGLLHRQRNESSVSMRLSRNFATRSTTRSVSLAGCAWSCVLDGPR